VLPCPGTGGIYLSLFSFRIRAVEYRTDSGGFPVNKVILNDRIDVLWSVLQVTISTFNLGDENNCEAVVKKLYLTVRASLDVFVRPSFSFFPPLASPYPSCHRVPSCS